MYLVACVTFLICSTIPDNVFDEFGLDTNNPRVQDVLLIYRGAAGALGITMAALWLIR